VKEFSGLSDNPNMLVSAPNTKYDHISRLWSVNPCPSLAISRYEFDNSLVIWRVVKSIEGRQIVSKLLFMDKPDQSPAVETILCASACEVWNADVIVDPVRHQNSPGK
jgi:hypothetical protein